MSPRTGRRLSALLVDDGTPGLGRDLIADVRAQGAVTVVVTDGRVHRDWDALGCATALHPSFTTEELLSALERHARPVERHVHRPAHLVVEPTPTRSHLIGVTGAGGAGSSTVAMCQLDKLRCRRHALTAFQCESSGSTPRMRLRWRPSVRQAGCRACS